MDCLPLVASLERRTAQLILPDGGTGIRYELAPGGSRHPDHLPLNGKSWFGSMTASWLRLIVSFIAAAGGVNAQGLGFAIWPDNAKTFVNFGAVITAFVTFLITAAVVYFIFVAPMNEINELTKRRASIEEPADEPLPADTALLVEIRDLLTELAAANKSNENAR